MTLSKLARLANVSVSVVSKAFSGREDISDAMREHVFAVAREHGCFQQFYHAPYDRPVVAVIIPEVISRFYIHYLEALKRNIEAHGYTMLLSISNFDAQMSRELVRYYTEHSKVDGLIVFGDKFTLPKESDTAVVCIGGESGGNPSGVCVSRPLGVGLEAALCHLQANGHRRIAYVGEAFTQSKAELMAELMRKIGLEVEPSYMVCSRFRFAEAGRDGVARLWSLASPPTAILGAYGYITQGILAELRARGVTVPREVSVISMDSDPDPLDGELDVSCLPSGIEEVCEQVLQALHRRIRAPRRSAPERITLHSTFYSGDTDAVCPR